MAPPLEASLSSCFDPVDQKYARAKCLAQQWHTTFNSRAACITRHRRNVQISAVKPLDLGSILTRSRRKATCSQSCPRLSSACAEKSKAAAKQGEALVAQVVVKVLAAGTRSIFSSNSFQGCHHRQQLPSLQHARAAQEDASLQKPPYAEAGDSGVPNGKPLSFTPHHMHILGARGSKQRAPKNRSRGCHASPWILS